MNSVKIGLTLVLLLAVSMEAGCSRALAMPQVKATSATGQNDSQIQADLTKQLSSSRFSGVKATVENGVITLSGDVGVYQTKEDADKKAHRVKNVIAVRNLIEVGGKEVSDQELGQTLAKKLAYDRVGYGNVSMRSN
jgi:hyperosmotically inducible periplasmic protein